MGRHDGRWRFGAPRFGHPRRTAALVLGLLVVLTSFTGAEIAETASGSRAAAATGTGLSAWSPGRPGSFRIGYTDPDAAAAEAKNKRVFILNPDAHRFISQIKQANPEALVLAYKDLASTRSNDYAYDAATGKDRELLATGVGYGYANQNHPEWFLTDGSGNRLEWQPYPGSWQMDVGNADYQRTWAANVKADLEAYGWDGVFMDNANTSATAYTPPSSKYPTDADMTAATRSMLAAVAPPLREAGLVSVANIGGARLVPGLWEDWISLLDGAMEEHFVNWSSDVGGPYVWDWGPDGWKAIVDEVATAARLGKMAVVRVGGASGDVEAMRYGLASYLLANDGRSVIAPPEFANPPTYPEFSWDLGTPTGAYRHLGNSVYRRDFSAGTVIVNAAKDASATVPLGGTYLDANGAKVTSVTLGGTRGAILRSAAPAPTRPAGRSPARGG